jgi:hypothetical protein
MFENELMNSEVSSKNRKTSGDRRSGVSERARDESDEEQEYNHETDAKIDQL